MSSIERPPHCLKAEKTLAMPRNLVFFDCETIAERLDDGRTKQRLKLGWACCVRRAFGKNRERREYKGYDTSKDFWDFIDSYTQFRQKLWVLSRNLVFDFTVVGGWENLRRMGYKLRFFYCSGLTNIISVRGKKGSIVFLDILNYFVESLEKTGERIGIPKLKIDFSTCTDDYLSTYCKRDVEIEVDNFLSFISFLEDKSISRLAYTRASTAMAAYLFSHYKHKIYIHNNKQAIDLERAGYKGGRCECFYLGGLKNDNYYFVDVNSLYPFVMRNNSYPCKYTQIVKEPSKSTLLEATRFQSVVAHVLLNTDEPVYAVRRERTIFPVGTFWTVLCTPEIQYALKRGHILKTAQAVFYEQAPLFKSYVDKFYGLRQQFKITGQSEYEEIAKKMLNSLYGKFGQKCEEWEKIGECPNEPDRIEILFVRGKHRTRQLRYLLGEIFELVRTGESFNSFPAIAAHVTAYGRLYLWQLMQQVGEGNYFYCDTDSLIVNQEGLCRLKDKLDNALLGGLKIVEITQSLTIKGLKDYLTPTKQVVKGIRKNAAEIAAGVYSQETWPSFKGVLREAQSDSYTIKKTVKVLTRKYTKGTVTAEGLVLPFALDESELSFPLLF
ncbi:MAG: hypothetical protein MUP81_03680 [Dehalococcoidia bacterium]|nr:hypothetical protein [Dehalococcoidia bacterium]